MLIVRPSAKANQILTGLRSTVPHNHLPPGIVQDWVSY
jgi:hypothetical protein